MSAAPDAAQQQALIEGIDIHNADDAHQTNAAALRMFPFQRNIFNLLARSTGLFPPFMGTILAICNGKTRTIPLLDYQLIILRLSGSLGAEYEFSVNEPVARVYELGDQKIEALRKGLKSEELFAMGVWSERQQCIITLVDESLATYTNKEETVLWAKKLITEDQIVEVYIVLGMFSTIARITRGLRVQQDPPIENLDKFIRDGVTKNANDP